MFLNEDGESTYLGNFIRDIFTYGLRKVRLQEKVLPDDTMTLQSSRVEKSRERSPFMAIEVRVKVQ